MMNIGRSAYVKIWQQHLVRARLRVRVVVRVKVGFGVRVRLLVRV